MAIWDGGGHKGGVKQVNYPLMDIFGDRRRGRWVSGLNVESYQDLLCKVATFKKKFVSIIWIGFYLNFQQEVHPPLGPLLGMSPCCFSYKHFSLNFSYFGKCNRHSVKAALSLLLCNNNTIYSIGSSNMVGSIMFLLGLGIGKLYSLLHKFL